MPDWFTENANPDWQPGGYLDNGQGQKTFVPGYLYPDEASYKAAQGGGTLEGIPGAGTGFDESAPVVGDSHSPPAPNTLGALTNYEAMLAPWTQSFGYQPYVPTGTYQPPAEYQPGNVSVGAYQAPGPFVAPSDFKAPTEAEVEATPGFKFQFGQGIKALQNSAAAHGTLLSGNTMEALVNYGQGLASTSYQSAWNRAKAENDTTYGRRFGENQNIYTQGIGAYTASTDAALRAAGINASTGLGAAQLNASTGLGAAQFNATNAQNAWQNNYQKALTEYGIARENFYGNQDRPYAKDMGWMDLGLRATAEKNANDRFYADLATRTMTDQQRSEYETQKANAEAAGKVAGGNAWGKAIADIGGNLGDLALYGAYTKKKPTTPGVYV